MGRQFGGDFLSIETTAKTIRIYLFEFYSFFLCKNLTHLFNCFLFLSSFIVSRFELNGAKMGFFTLAKVLLYSDSNRPDSRRIFAGSLRVAIHLTHSRLAGRGAQKSSSLPVRAETRPFRNYHFFL